MIAISGTTKDTQVGSIGSMEDVDKKFPRFRPHWSAHLFGHCAVLMPAENTYHYMWQNRQIKTLIKRNGRHLNTSGALA